MEFAMLNQADYMHVTSPEFLHFVGIQVKIFLFELLLLYVPCKDHLVHPLETDCMNKFQRKHPWK